MSNYKVGTSIVINRYEETIKENIEIFNNILETAKNINPNIKILCLLLPRYYKAQEKNKELYIPWKDEFYKIINNAKEKHYFDFYDLKEIELSKHSELFYDISHFNYAGAIQFSKYLQSIIDKLYS